MFVIKKNLNDVTKMKKLRLIDSIYTENLQNNDNPAKRNQ